MKNSKVDSFATAPASARPGFGRLSNRALHRTGLLAVLSLPFLAACAANPQSRSDAAAASVPRDANQLLVVDCLLPSQVRKLGSQLTFLAPRRATKSSASDCEIRGGEYAAYDRADYRTALNVWLPEAKAGNAVAQTYVGEIYEKGLGVTSQPEIALAWYRRAAEQGEERAMINLGFLYETGQGVAPDLVTAMNWYRRASGLDDSTLEYVSAVEVAQRTALQAETVELRAETSSLRSELAAAQQQLSQRQVALRSSERRATQLRREIQTARAAPAARPATPAVVTAPVSEPSNAVSDAELARLRAELASSRNEVASSRSALQAADQQLARAREDLDNTSRSAALSDAAQRNELERLRASVAQQQAVAERQRTQAAALERALTAERTAFEIQLDAVRARAEKALETARSNSATASAQDSASSDAAQQRLALSEAELARAQAQRATVEAQLERATLESDALRARVAAASSELEAERTALAITARELETSRGALDAAQRGGAADRARLAELEATIAFQEESLLVQRDEANKARQLLEQERSGLGARLQTSQSNESALKSQLQAAVTQVSTMRVALTRERSGRSDSEAQIRAREAELATLESELQTERAAVAALESEIEREATPIAGPAIEAVANIVSVGPNISLIEPELVVLRDAATPSVRLRSAAARFGIIGRVESAQALVSFRVNDREQQPDETGLFRADVNVAGDETPVNIVAVDGEGRRAALDFVLLRPQASEVAAPEAPVVPVSADINFGRYYALVIGNGAYTSLTPLSSPVNDARQVASVLRSRYGFDVTTLINATRYDILSALADLRGRLTAEDNLVIYYAGHGELDSVNQRGYWLPVDAEPENPAKWISNVTITDQLNVMAAKHILVVADSCYSGTLTRSAIARPPTSLSAPKLDKWYRVMARTPARLVLTSGGVKPVLDSGGGEHSVFARALLDTLRSNTDVLDGYSLFVDVHQQVRRASVRYRLDQNPRYAPIQHAGHEAGEFFFRPRETRAEAASVLVAAR